MIRLGTLYAIDSARGRLNPFPDPRQRLLLDVVLGRDDEAREAWRRWQSETDFQRDVDAAAFALMGLVFHRVQALRLHTPPEILGRLRGIYRFLWSKNQSALTTLRSAHTVLAANKLPVMVLGGLAILDRCYHDRGLRLVDALDILLPEAGVEAAHSNLHAAGWHSTRNPEQHWRSVVHGIDYRLPSMKSLSLRWRPYLLSSPQAAEAALWQRAETTRIGDCEVQVPDLHDQLVLACFQGRLTNPGEVTRWVVDAHLIARTIGRPDWPLVQARATEAGLEQAVGEALRYLHEEWGLGPRPIYRIPRVTSADRLLCRSEELFVRLATLPETSPRRRLLGPPVWLSFHGLRYWLVRRRRGLGVTLIDLARHLRTELRRRHRRTGQASGQGGA